MSLSFYHSSISTYLQTLGGVDRVLDKGAAFAAENELELDALADIRLRDDMQPFSFQIISVWHHSLGAIRGMKEGAFAPPPKLGDMNFDRCKALVREATEELQAESVEAIEALADQPMVFRVSGNEIPFNTTNFLMSFSLPNFFFHATTAYDMLRMQGVPLGKMDYLGQLRSG